MVVKTSIAEYGLPSRSKNMISLCGSYDKKIESFCSYAGFRCVLRGMDIFVLVRTIVCF